MANGGFIYMVEINDKMLLDEVIGFCDTFSKSAIVKKYTSEESELSYINLMSITKII